jgi:hypothetical protein
VTIWEWVNKVNEFAAYVGRNIREDRQRMTKIEERLDALERKVP